MRGVASAGFLAAALTAIPHAAGATVVLTNSDANNEVIGVSPYEPTSITENGFAISISGTDIGFSQNGPSFALIGTGTTFTIQASDSGNFTFDSVDVGDAFDGSGNGQTLTVTGTLAAGGTVTDTLTGASNGSMTTLAAVLLAGDPLSSLQLYITSSAAVWTSFANVNLTEQAVATPEPASLALLGAGAAGLAAIRRRKRINLNGIA